MADFGNSLLAAAKATEKFREIEDEIPTEPVRYPAFYLGSDDTNLSPRTNSRKKFDEEREYVVYIAAQKRSELETLRDAFLSQAGGLIPWITRLQWNRAQVQIGEVTAWLDVGTIYTNDDNKTVT